MFRSICVAVTLSLTPALAVAAPINYGDFSDIPPGSVMYLDVTESANTPEPPGGFRGPPTISGNTLDFDPPAANIISTSSGPVSVQYLLNATLMTDPGEVIVNINVNETFVYSLQGDTGASASIFVGLNFAVAILEVDGAALGSPINLSLSPSFSRSLSGDGPATDAMPSTGAGFNLDAELVSNGIITSGGVTKLAFNVTTDLSADASGGGFAEVGLSDSVIRSSTRSVAVPAPATGMVMAAGLLAVGAAGRRARRVSA